jgi:hypothetical protein
MLRASECILSLKFMKLLASLSFDKNSQIKMFTLFNHFFLRKDAGMLEIYVSLTVIRTIFRLERCINPCLVIDYMRYVAQRLVLTAFTENLLFQIARKTGERRRDFFKKLSEMHW